MAEIKNFNKQVNVIGLMKMNRMVTIGNKNYKASDIPDIKRKNIKYSNKLKCHYITQKIGYKNIGMRAYWIKIKGQNNWCLLVSTNEKLTFIKAMEYYQIRWGIEVFFKDCKQNLKLGDCQSKDFDAHIASISIVFMNYMVLALKKRFEDYETLGILFRNFKDMMLQRTLIQRIWAIIIELFDSVLIQFGVNWEEFMQCLIQNKDQIMEQFYKTFENLFSLNSRKIA
jgi:RNAse (barnase) inhibitor barstar